MVGSLSKAQPVGPGGTALSALPRGFHGKGCTPSPREAPGVEMWESVSECCPVTVPEEERTAHGQSPLGVSVAACPQLPHTLQRPAGPRAPSQTRVATSLLTWDSRSPAACVRT